jgi:hypothetical protein
MFHHPHTETRFTRPCSLSGGMCLPVCCTSTAGFKAWGGNCPVAGVSHIPFPTVMYCHHPIMSYISTPCVTRVALQEIKTCCLLSTSGHLGCMGINLLGNHVLSLFFLRVKSWFIMIPLKYFEVWFLYVQYYICLCQLLFFKTMKIFLTHSLNTQNLSVLNKSMANSD